MIILLLHAVSFSTYCYSVYHDNYLTIPPSSSRSEFLMKSIGGNYKYLTHLNLVSYLHNYSDFVFQYMSMINFLCFLKFCKLKCEWYIFILLIFVHVCMISNPLKIVAMHYFLSWCIIHKFGSKTKAFTTIALGKMANALNIGSYSN